MQTGFCCFTQWVNEAIDNWAFLSVCSRVHPWLNYQSLRGAEGKVVSGRYIPKLLEEW